MPGINAHPKEVLWHRVSKAALALLVGALLFSLLGLITTRDTKLLDREGVELEAEVVDKTNRRKSIDSELDRYYFLVMNVEPEGEAPRQERVMVDGFDYRKADVGDRLPVVYVPDRPGVIRLQSQSTRRQYDIFRLGLIMAAIAVFLLWRGAGDMASAVRAARNGSIRKARITGTVDTGGKANKGRKAKKEVPVIRLQWTDADGKSGQTEKNAADQLSAWTEGDEIAICTDPKTGRDWWVEDLCPGRSEGQSSNDQGTGQ